MNGHVLKYIRWNHFVAMESKRGLAQLYWASVYGEELKRNT